MGYVILLWHSLSLPYNYFLNKYIKLFEGRSFVISSHLVLALERTKSRKHCMVKTYCFDRFMMSELAETLILAFTSKTGQSVAHIRHKLF